MIRAQLTNGQLLLPLKVTPKGGRDCLLPFKVGDLELKLKVSSPPEDGKANAAVLVLIAEILKLPKGQLKIAQGEKSRHKRVSINNVAAEDIPRLLAILASHCKSEPDTMFQLS